ncbi:MAG: hypothetical protein ACYDEJ_09345 [Desulfitobacteriaceae bacterium]
MIFEIGANLTDKQAPKQGIFPFSLKVKYLGIDLVIRGLEYRLLSKDSKNYFIYVMPVEAHDRPIKDALDSKTVKEFLTKELTKEGQGHSGYWIITSPDATVAADWDYLHEYLKNFVEEKIAGGRNREIKVNRTDAH